MKHLDLCSGIGGFALAAQWAGFDTVAFCEIDPWCRQVLKQHWPNVPMHEDVRELDGTEYQAIDLLTAGYPCQPFSLAGKRKGEKDDRHIWPELLRIIKQARPTWIVTENVVGHITMGLDQVLTDLENENYTSRTLIIPACGVDAPHRRDRIWTIANCNGARELQQSRCQQESGNGISDIRKNVSNTTGERPQERKLFQGRESETEYTLEREAAERNHWWPTEPDVCRVANGIPNRVDRIKGLGNAIVPQVAYQILRGISEI